MKPISKLADFGRQPHAIDAVGGPVDRKEVFRYLGYPSDYKPAEKIDREIDTWVKQASEAAQPRASFVMFAIDRNEQTVSSPRGRPAVRLSLSERSGNTLASRTTSPPSSLPLGLASKNSPSSRKAEGDLFAALVINGVGAERVEAAVFVVTEKLRIAAATEQLRPTLPYAPGYCVHGIDRTEEIVRSF